MALTSVQTHVKSFTASEPHEPTGLFLISLRDILWLILQYYPSIQLERLRKFINLRTRKMQTTSLLNSNKVFYCYYTNLFTIYYSILMKPPASSCPDCSI